MAKSIRVNFIYNVINTVSGLIFPLITYPYVFRILLADGVGQVNFYNSIISYITLLTGLGIPLYGIREIARVRDDIKELTQTTVEILSLNLLLNIVGYVVVFILCFTVEDIRQDYPLFLLLSISIILTTIGCPWFYNGIEDFKFVTLRGIAVRIICTVFLFVAVKTKQDLYWYGLYYVLVSTGNYIVNFLFLRKRISVGLIKWSDLNIGKHIKPALAVFIFNLITSIYLNLDKLMLGFIKDAQAVGYYTAATQLSHVFLTLATALGAVMLPRSSNLIKTGQIEEFYRLSNKSYNFILMLTMPFCFGCMVMSPVLIHLFCGPSYEPSITTLKIICPIIVALGMSNLIGMQMLYPLGKINIVTISTCVGAALNLVLNLCLIPLLAQDGAAIATVAAEVSVTTTQIVLARKYICFNPISKEFLRYFSSAFVMSVVCFFIIQIRTPDILLLFVVPFIGALVYLSILLIFKDKLVIEIFNTLKLKISHYV